MEKNKPEEHRSSSEPTRPHRDGGAPGAGSRGTGSHGRRGAATRPVGPRRERYLVAPLPAEFLPSGLGPDFVPLEPAMLVDQINADPTTQLVRVVPSRSRQLTAFGNDPVAAPFPDVVVVEMDADRAAMFAATPLLHIEPDQSLHYNDPGPLDQFQTPDPGLVPLGETAEIVIEVLGGGKPLEGAEIFVLSNTFPVRGTTGADGHASLAVPADALGNVTGLYVKPKFDHWSAWHTRPQLVPGEVNSVECTPLSETFNGFPTTKELDSWARRVMRFDALPPTFRGDGVKVAIIDSGAAVDHPDLTGRFAGGRDITTQTDDGWRVDELGHGSHCAGIIGGRDTGVGVLGIVPEAELHSCKVFPGGRFSDLIEALDYCIEHDIDVVNLSLGSAQPSELVARKVEQARQAGVACVVAAGNSAGPVSFPASMPSVLAVAAIGKLGEFPPESYHSTQVSGAPTADGFFSAKFTCFGPEIDVCAPGVAIVSSVPPANYAALDGTSFAGPCVAGLAALVLAHHQDFRGPFQLRNAARVDRLFEIIRSSCRPLPFSDPGRGGAGLPDAAVAVGLLPSQPAAPVPAGLTPTQPSMGHIAMPVGAGAAGMPGIAGPGVPIGMPGMPMAGVPMAGMFPPMQGMFPPMPGGYFPGLPWGMTFAPVPMPGFAGAGIGMYAPQSAGFPTMWPSGAPLAPAGASPTAAPSSPSGQQPSGQQSSGRNGSGRPSDGAGRAAESDEALATLRAALRAAGLLSVTESEATGVR